MAWASEAGTTVAILVALSTVEDTKGLVTTLRNGSGNMVATEAIWEVGAVEISVTERGDLSRPIGWRTDHTLTVCASAWSLLNLLGRLNWLDLLRS